MFLRETFQFIIRQYTVLFSLCNEDDVVLITFCGKWNPRGKDVKERMKTDFIWMLAWLPFVTVAANLSEWSSFVSSFYTKKRFSLFSAVFDSFSWKVRSNHWRKQLCRVRSYFSLQNCCLLYFFFRRNDKVIVFSDNVFALKKYAEKLKKWVWFLHI